MHGGAESGLSAGSVRVGLTTTSTDPDQDQLDKKNQHNVVARKSISNSLSSSSSSDDDDDDDDDFAGYGSDQESESLGAIAIITETDKLAISNCDIDNFKEGHLTANASSERCFGVRKLLEEQHRKWVHLLPQNNAGHTLQEWWADKDSYNLTAFGEVNGVWPLNHPLPLPDWTPTYSEHAKGTLHFDTVWQYEDFNAIIETKLRRMLEETPYDTVHLFLAFYRAFKRTRRSDLKSFFQFYDIPINRRHHMCVSLGMEIVTRILSDFPILEYYLYMVSCEEQVPSQREYIMASEEVGGLQSPHANVEKEHAMVAMKISVAGREGVMILDPGYHVGRAVTVMKDQAYPHTGWFTQSKESHLQRDYCYVFSAHSHKYVDWMERSIRGDQVAIKSSLVYVEQQYITAIDVTVRRNLVYNFRSLLARDAKGRVYAGIYFPILANCNEAHLTMFYDGPNEQRVKVKFMFNVYKNAHKIPDHVQQHINKLAPQLNIKPRELAELCKSLAEVVTDQDFVKQTLAINDDIGNIGD